MTTSKDVKKEPAKRINTPDSMALYRNFGTGKQHAHQGTVEQEHPFEYEPKGDSSAAYNTPEANKLSNRTSMTDSTTQDLSEYSTENESETNLMPIELNKGGFFYNWTYPLRAKAGKHEE
jgi:hypothetical protein